MAYMSQERKAQISPKVKEILKKHNLKGSLRVDHHSELQLTIKSGKIDFIGSYNKAASKRNQWGRPIEPFTGNNMNINVYHFRTQFEGKALAALVELIEAMNEGNWDKSDIQSDYHNVGWYIDVSIGKWNKPYELTA